MVEVYKDYQRRQVEKHNSLQIEGKSGDIGPAALDREIDRATCSRMTNPMDITNEEEGQPAHQQETIMMPHIDATSPEQAEMTIAETARRQMLDYRQHSIKVQDKREQYRLVTSSTYKRKKVGSKSNAQTRKNLHSMQSNRQLDMYETQTT